MNLRNVIAALTGTTALAILAAIIGAAIGIGTGAALMWSIDQM